MTGPRSARSLWVILLPAAVTAGYYVWHKPVTLELVVRLAGSTGDLAIGLAIVALAGALGRALAPGEGLHPLERAAVQAALGLGALSLLWLGIGSAGLLTVWAGRLVLAAAAIGLRGHLAGWARDAAAARGLLSVSGAGVRLLAAAAAGIVLGRILFALAPAISWDSLVYHLALPRAYIAQGSTAVIESNPFSGTPQLAEMLYVWAMLLGAAPAATALAWWVGVAALLGVAGLVLGHVQAGDGPAMDWRPAAVVALTAVLSGYTARDTLSSGYTEYLSALFGMSVVSSLIAARRTSRVRWWAVAGACAGFAAATKLSAVISLACLLPFVVWAWPSSRDRRAALLAGAAAAALPLIPWGMRNLAFTGNPAYPFLADGAAMTAERLGFFTYAASAWTAGPGQLILRPLLATWHGIDGAPGGAADLGPLLLALGLVGLVAGRRDPVMRCAGIAFLLWWLVTGLAALASPLLEQSRMYAVLLPAAALAAARGWQAIQTVSVGQVRTSRVASALVITVISLACWQEFALHTALNPAGVLTGAVAEERYLANALGDHYAAMRALDTLPGGFRAIMLWEPRGLYAPTSARADVWIDTWYMARRAGWQPGDAAARWASQGYTHLLLATGGADFELSGRPEYRSGDREALGVLLAGLGQPVASMGTYRVYALGSR